MRGRASVNTLALLGTFLLLTISILPSLQAYTLNAKTLIINPTVNIQHTINTAPTGSTIILQNGVYNQTFTITKTLTITGEHPLHTIINAETEQNKPAITILASNTSISNLTVVNSGPGLYTTGIRISVPYTTITNCVFQHTPIGISIWTSNNTIRNCTFHHCQDEGIVLIGSTTFTCSNNLITDCTFYNNGDGIELQHAIRNTISNCTITNNTHSGIDAISSQNNHNIISNCTITDNSVHGIYLSKSYYNTISHCVVKHNTDGNIIQTGGATNTIIHPPPTPHLNNITVSSTQLLPSSEKQLLRPTQSTSSNVITRPRAPSTFNNLFLTLLLSIKNFFTH